MRVGLSMRIDEITSYSEMRDSIDQRWFDFAKSCGFEVFLIPNNVEIVHNLLNTIEFDGFILTGGNEVNDPKTKIRDQVEDLIFKHSIKNNRPIIGVCRGMQALGVYFGEKLEPVQNHVGEHKIVKGEVLSIVNSYHNNAFTKVGDQFEVLAYSLDDNYIESIKHKLYPFLGIMWHPERNSPFITEDITFFKNQIERK